MNSMTSHSRKIYDTRKVRRADRPAREAKQLARVVSTWFLQSGKIHAQQKTAKEHVQVSNTYQEIHKIFVPSPCSFVERHINPKDRFCHIEV